MARTVTHPLREGFTTGTAATGAALAALTLLRTGRAPDSVDVPLPPFTPAAGEKTFAGRGPRGWRTLPVAGCAPGPAAELNPDLLPAPAQAAGAAHASIRKDGGDDPDATSGALITASVLLRDCEAPLLAPDDPDFTRIEGGPGVGRVTLPGLPLPVGTAAINPVPREQLGFALGRQAARPVPGSRPLRPLLTVIISVPQAPKSPGIPLIRAWALWAAFPFWAPKARSAHTATPPGAPPSNRACMWPRPRAAAKSAFPPDGVRKTAHDPLPGLAPRCFAGCRF